MTRYANHCALQRWTVGDTGFCELCGILGYTANNPYVPLSLGPQWEMPCILVEPEGLGAGAGHSAHWQCPRCWSLELLSSKTRSTCLEEAQGSKNGQQIVKCVQAEMQIKTIGWRLPRFGRWVWLLWGFAYKISIVKFFQITEGEPTSPSALGFLCSIQ